MDNERRTGPGRRTDPGRGTPRRVGSSRERAVRQAHDILRSSIRRGLLGPDNPLVEFQLIRSLGIGRNTVRASLQTLADEGLVTRRPGVGTLVARPMLRVSADEILAFDDGDPDPARRVAVEVLADEPVEIGEVLSRTLGLRSGSMRVLEALVGVDGEPVCLLATFMAPDVDISRFTRSYELVAVSFERLVGVPLGTATTTVEAVNADAWTAGMLAVAPGSALILREQVLTATDGSATILNFARYRADRAVFVASGRGSQTTDAPTTDARTTDERTTEER